MKYMGSKARIAKYILPIILADRKTGDIFYDVFCGGGNIIENVVEPRIGIDNNRYLIEALKWIRDDAASLPKNSNEFTEDNYNICRLNRDWCPSLTGYAGFALSYGGKFFGGFRRDKIGKRDYINEAYRAALKQANKLKGAEFICSNYDDFDYKKNSIIYCDKPYEGTTKYKDLFDHKKFWGWAENMCNEGHNLFVSEYNAPSNWTCLWEKEIVSSLTKDTGSKKGVERLFTL